MLVFWETAAKKKMYVYGYLLGELHAIDACIRVVVWGECVASCFTACQGIPADKTLCYLKPEAFTQRLREGQVWKIFFLFVFSFLLDGVLKNIQNYVEVDSKLSRFIAIV